MRHNGLQPTVKKVIRMTRSVINNSKAGLNKRVILRLHLNRQRELLGLCLLHPAHSLRA